MKNTIPEVDAYIENSEPFAQPILEKVRKLFHKACPEIQEVMKWSMPFFEYKGLVGYMSSFKKHCRYGFWKGSLLKDPLGLFKEKSEDNMAAQRLESLSDLPADKDFIAYIKEAVALNEAGIKEAKPKRKASTKEVTIPDDLAAALKKNKKAQAGFDAFSPSHKREYIEWIEEAKREETRLKRMTQAIEWIAEGKSRHWNYQKK